MATCLGFTSEGTIVYEAAPNAYVGINAWGEVRCSCPIGKKQGVVRVSSIDRAIACDHIHSVARTIRQDLDEIIEGRKVIAQREVAA